MSTRSMTLSRTGQGVGRRRSVRSRIAEGLLRSGFLAAVNATRPGSLTVLAYHRIEDPDAVAGKGLVANVSATPEAFSDQMRLIARWFDVITLEHFLNWLRGRARLPHRAALITFDDGYHDNLRHAFPILKEHGVPATLFVTTGGIGNDRPFYWDLAAFAFSRTRRASADLPLLGRRPLDTPDARECVLRDWVAAAKLEPEAAKNRAVEALPAALDVEVASDAFAGQHLDWDQLQAITAGFSIGAHTVSHPILSRVPLGEARREITVSKQTLEARLGRPVTTFAYPNGQDGDYGEEHVELLRETGYEAAFCLDADPLPLSGMKRAPFRIPRVCITLRDDLPRFALKVSGLMRLVARR